MVCWAPQATLARGRETTHGDDTVESPTDLHQARRVAYAPPGAHAQAVCLFAGAAARTVRRGLPGRVGNDVSGHRGGQATRTPSPVGDGDAAAGVSEGVGCRGGGVECDGSALAVGAGLLGRHRAAV